MLLENSYIATCVVKSIEHEVYTYIYLEIAGDIGSLAVRFHLLLMYSNARAREDLIRKRSLAVYGTGTRRQSRLATNYGQIK